MKNVTKRTGTRDMTEIIELPQAIERLLRIAGQDTGGGRRVAAFLLSLWNGDFYRADLQALLYVDRQIHKDMITVMIGLYESHGQLSTYVTEEQISPVIDMWGETLHSGTQS